jgi:hypothetical protein
VLGSCPASFQRTSIHPDAVTLPDLPADRLWSQREAAYYLGVSARYLRDSDCPKVLLPGNGKAGHPIVRYDPADVKAWASRWNTKNVNRPTKAA